MAIVVQGSNNKIVSSILERDNLIRKFEGLVVTVLDASDDPLISSGRAVYRYTFDNWVLETTDNLEILTSNDDSLNTLQEVVDYIKTMKSNIDILLDTPYNLNIGTY